MKKLCHLSNNILIVSILLIFFFPPGAFYDCVKYHIYPAIEIDALIGSCVEIPCRFDDMPEFDDKKVTFGVWMKHSPHESNIVYNGKSINTYQMEMTGNIKRKNCSIRIPDLTTDHAHRYYFRVENGPFKASFCDDAVTLRIRDSAWSPEIDVSESDLKEHQSVTITCSAYTPCSHSPPALTWNIKFGSVRQIDKMFDGVFKTKIKETITLDDKHHQFNIKCTAKYPVKGGFKQAEAGKTLIVSHAPAATVVSMSPKGLVSPGTNVELTCSSRANPPVTGFTWFKNSRRGAIQVSSAKTFSFSATEREAYYCEATNKHGSQKSESICIDIKGAPYIPSINIPSGDLKEHQSITATCSAFTPCKQSTPTLTWNLDQDSLTKTGDKTNRTFTTKIQKTFTLTYKHDGFIIKCFSKHHATDKVMNTEVTLNLPYSPKETTAYISQSSDEKSDDGWVELSCSSRAKPPPSFTWFKKGSQIDTPVATGIYHKVKLTQGGQYFCVAANTLGTQKSSPVSVNVSVKGTPGLWIYIVIAMLGIGFLRSTRFMVKKWLQTASSSQAH